MAMLGQSAAEAGRAVIQDEIPGLGGDGGAIVPGADGEVAMPFGTRGMYRGWIGADGVPHVTISAAMGSRCRHRLPGPGVPHSPASP
ncbi:hypothetical protein BV497_16130 [Fulvimonas soli]|jgi:beta-aspartyl-peptidase (threonine type)|uniref:Asparaginase n=1 Tax=Fulvimonas soli TaxID=155197 RepID=A0A316I2A1_9GAMM|nr:asparaginase [Fulvimonas soli]TNY25006.1 hypothetical protein BV497_16130 [Fulvimonas soli]